jgi:hypothetical protein
MVAACSRNEMKIVIDIHRVGNNRQEETPDIGIQEFGRGINNKEDFMLQVIKLMGRYSGNTSVVGVNSWNEYTGTDTRYKRDWDIHFFNHIEASYPGRFWYFATGMLWGGYLTGYSLEDQAWSNRLTYSTHKYHFSGSGNRQDWEGSFGNAFPPNRMIVGEYGFRNPEDMQWGRDFTSYLVEKGIKNHCFWTVAHSGDTGGLWRDDCNTFDEEKYEILKKLLA